jgi:hypothetical protein
MFFHVDVESFARDDVWMDERGKAFEIFDQVFDVFLLDNKSFDCKHFPA